ncbi:MAG: O-methyltransferase [Armatimonadota bacterium]|nr:O-methyltransferase [Armatimonadota bacterium]MCX7777202.1 O-methyltransferase [Armatimonadota bacterium]MDW8025029.1 O-methyltransferase [Armatimonadota bacterium]
MKRRELLMTTFGTLGWLAANRIGAVETVSLRERQREIEPILEELEEFSGKFSNVPRTDGQLLNMLVKIARAKNVLEVGTSNGYSAIWLCLALEETDGYLTTIEINPERVKMAKENLKRVGLSHRATVIEGDGHKIVPTLDGKFDFVFLDADKGREQDYFGYLYPKKLAIGAIIAVHNAIRMRGAMKRYLEMITSHPEFDTVFVSTTLDDGFAISYWRRR